MPLLLVFFGLAALELGGGALVIWAGAHTLREEWILHHRGVRRPAIAERLTSKAGPVGIYRFLGDDGLPRIANVDRARKRPAVEVTIVFDPQNTALAREGRGLLAGIFGALAVVIGTVLIGVATASFVMLSGAWA